MSISASQALQRLEVDHAVLRDDRRLQELAAYGIMDTGAEQDFEDAVILASELCLTPTALVSFINQDRHWLKARRGTEACEIPIGHSICAFAVSQVQPIVIPDLRLDPRTRDNPLVTMDPRLCFYAGVPLVTPNGLAIGTVCVLDTMPRPQGLTAGQAAGLEALTRLVMGMLEARVAAANNNRRRLW